MLKSKSLIKGFTLIELLIVIGILAVLATTVLLVLNPAQMVKQSRDGNRMVELQSINKALLLFQSFGGSSESMGTHGDVYVSLPSSNSDCSDLGLPVLSTGSYHCATASNYRNTDGTGWIPVNFTSIQSNAGSLFANLPIDPVNTVANDYYYTYIPGSWALSATMESEKYLAANAVNDGGQLDTRFEVGNSLSLNGSLRNCSATGGTITQINGYCIHTFTSNATFIPAESGNVEYLVVAGGGGGNTGGGGGGGFRTGTIAVTAQAYSIIVGIGGIAGANGSNSVFSTITSIGGGAGATVNANGISGGSGGGGGGSGPAQPRTGGTATSGQGNNGGYNPGTAAPYAAAGGGGAGGVGSDTVSGSIGGNGGPGLASSISGSSVYYAGGGGGGTSNSGGTGGLGGSGGGGGGSGSGTTGFSGVANTGGGGGGGAQGIAGSNGGSGIVIIRYLL